jgi:predicted DCC family thiol-disulfide oxidoreductase YuxK
VQSADPRGPVLLYDGSCGFCSRTVQFVLRHEHAKRLRFARLDGAFAARLLEQHPSVHGADSVIWYEPDGDLLLLRSDAILRAAAYLGGGWRLASGLRVVPRRFRDMIYQVVARHRHLLSGQSPHCLIPPPDERRRFLDDPPM